MVSASRSRRSRKRGKPILKPRGTFHTRVRKVGPEHFGVVSVDCAKARSKWMLADFYGHVLVPPTVVAHNRPDLDAAIAQLHQAFRTHTVRDALVAVERTGRYHHPVQRAFDAAGLDTRIVHPFATKQFRQPADPGHKTDDTDLAAIHRAAVNGFALLDAPRPVPWLELQLLARHRRDLVRKASRLCCQIREHLNAAMPGYAECFADLWTSAAGLWLVRHVGLAADLERLGLDRLAVALRRDRVRFQERTLRKILAWAAIAPSPDPAGPTHRMIALALDDDRRQKEQAIQGVERQLAALLARTPYIVLLSIPGINVVSAAEYAGEMGPITRYANSKTITGRAGLVPSRSQSDAVDHADGPLVRCANRSLRSALLQIADNLIACSRYFGEMNERWKAQGKDARDRRVRVASRFARISFHMVAGGQVFRHPLARDRSYILQKLKVFHLDHGSSMEQTLADLQAAIDHLPRNARAEEAAPLVAELEALDGGRRRDPHRLGEILPLVLARLGIVPVQSAESGDRGPR